MLLWSLSFTSLLLAHSSPTGLSLFLEHQVHLCLRTFVLTVCCPWTNTASDMDVAFSLHPDLCLHVTKSEGPSLISWALSHLENSRLPLDLLPVQETEDPAKQFLAPGSASWITPRWRQTLEKTWVQHFSESLIHNVLPMMGSEGGQIPEMLNT